MWKLRLLARVDVGTGVGAGTRRDAMVTTGLLDVQLAPAVTCGVSEQIDIILPVRAMVYLHLRNDQREKIDQ
jgi:hypothetical protein